MTVTFEVKPEVETRLQQEATRLGLPVQELVTRVVNEYFLTPSDKFNHCWEELVRNKHTSDVAIESEAIFRERVYED